MRLVPNSVVMLVSASLLAATVASGCGGGGGGRDLADCGNGKLDHGEACDDGNLEDGDTCLSTCEDAACGDGYLEAGVEECDIAVLTTCAALGFRGGTLSCGSDCRYDTSGCAGAGGGTPIPTGTPAATAPGATATANPPSPTDGAATATPTAAPTPTGATCAGDESIALTVALDAEVTSARVDLAYPAAANLPGTGTDPAVKARVDFAGSGLTVVNDFDADEDLIDDTVTLSLVGTDLVPAGTFATVTFDCQAGAPVPTAASFACTVVSASNGGTSVTAGCTLRTSP
jgi:cysteine-rich repeat protein